MALRFRVKNSWQVLFAYWSGLKCSYNLKEAGKALRTGSGLNSIPQTQVHTEPQNVTLFGTRVFAGVIS